MKKGILLLFLILLNSCISSKDKELALEISKVLSTEHVRIKFGTEYIPSSETIEYLGIEILNPKSIKEGQSFKHFADFVAYSVFTNLDSTNFKSFHAIRIILKQTGVIENTYTNTYLLEDLNQIKIGEKVAKEFIIDFKNKNYSKVYHSFNSEIKSYLTQSSMIHSFENLFSKTGEIKSVNFTTFDIYKYDSDSTKGFNSIHYYGDLFFDSIAYKATIAVDNKFKIVKFEYNE